MMLENMIAVVTGAGDGIGAASALAFAEAGATVVCADLDLDAARRSAEQVRGVGREAMPIEVDCGEVAAIEGMFDAVIEAYGRLDVVLNNAGITRQADIMDVTEAEWEQIHRVNAKGVFFCLQGAARRMIPRGGGRIINMASVGGRGYIGTTNAAYAASKGAVIALTKTAAQQLGRHNINVNAICPGVTLTPLIHKVVKDRAAEANVSDEEIRAMMAAPVPLRRVNEPEDIAAMALFLASPGARNITGQAYNVDGGLVPS